MSVEDEENFDMCVMECITESRFEYQVKNNEFYGDCNYFNLENKLGKENSIVEMLSTVDGESNCNAFLESDVVTSTTGTHLNNRVHAEDHSSFRNTTRTPKKIRSTTENSNDSQPSAQNDDINLYSIYKNNVEEAFQSTPLTDSGCPKESTPFEYRFDVQPYEIYKAFRLFNQEEDKPYFTRGCKWSPDGTCLISNSNDNTVRVFDLPLELYSVKPKDYVNWKFSTDGVKELACSAEIKEGELIYDFSWFPKMNSQNPLSCCFATTSKDHPVHLWDAYSGELRCSYNICFDLSGNHLYCGYNKCIKVFDVATPGVALTSRELKAGASPSQLGIISCIAFNPVISSVYAAGSYLRSIGLYSEPEGTLLCLLEGQVGGITHMLFSYDGFQLYSGGRKDSEIICWDIRNPGEILYVLHRDVVTNQRIYFDLDPSGQFLASGNSNGFVRVWRLNTAPLLDEQGERFIPPYADHELHRDCCNGISAGQRHYPDPLLDDSDSEEFDSDGESRPKVHRAAENEALASQPPCPQNVKVKVRPMTRKRYLEEKDFSVRMWWAGGGQHFWCEPPDSKET